MLKCRLKFLERSSTVAGVNCERSITNDRNRSSVCRATKQLSSSVPHLQTDPADSGNTPKERRYRGHFPFPHPPHTKSQWTIIPLARIQTSPSHAARLEPERRPQRRQRAYSTTLCGAGVHPEGLLYHVDLHSRRRRKLVDKKGFGQDQQDKVTPPRNPRPLTGSDAIRRRPLSRAQTVPRRRG